MTNTEATKAIAALHGYDMEDALAIGRTAPVAMVPRTVKVEAMQLTTTNAEDVAAWINARLSAVTVANGPRHADVTVSKMIRISTPAHSPLGFTYDVIIPGQWIVYENLRFTSMGPDRFEANYTFAPFPTEES